MTKKIVFTITFISLAFIIIGCDSKKVTNNKNTNIINNDKEDKKENYNEELKSVQIIIDDKKYIINLENNETVKAFIDILPQELTMSELNSNEKYTYLDNQLPTKPNNPKHIDAGDVMLYGNNCLVIFYKSFDTSYSYTKIGHINNLPDLGNSNVKIKIEK